PRLHQKPQFIASRALLEELALQPETHRALDLTLRQWGEGTTVTPERGPIPAQRRLEVARTLMEGHDHLPAPVRDSSLLYLAAGPGLGRRGDGGRRRAMGAQRRSRRLVAVRLDDRDRAGGGDRRAHPPRTGTSSAGWDAACAGRCSRRDQVAPRLNPASTSFRP